MCIRTVLCRGRRREHAAGAGFDLSAGRGVGRSVRHQPPHPLRRRVARRARLAAGRPDRVCRWPVRPGAEPGPDDHLRQAELRRLRPRDGVISPLDLSFERNRLRHRGRCCGTALHLGLLPEVKTESPAGALVKYDLVNHRIGTPGTFLPWPGSEPRPTSSWPRNGAVIAAGNFDQALGALNPTLTGADLNTINITVAGVVNSGDETRVRQLAVFPTAPGLASVATANFAHGEWPGPPAGLHAEPRPDPTLSTWHAARSTKTATCSPRQDSAQGWPNPLSRRHLLRDRRRDPGRPTGTNGMCGDAARFRLRTSVLRPSPRGSTGPGGDSLYSVAITGPQSTSAVINVCAGQHPGLRLGRSRAVSRPASAPSTRDRRRLPGTHRVPQRTAPWPSTPPTRAWVAATAPNSGTRTDAGIGFVPLDPTTDTADPTAGSAAAPALWSATTSTTPRRRPDPHRHRPPRPGRHSSKAKNDAARNDWGRGAICRPRPLYRAADRAT